MKIYSALIIFLITTCIAGCQKDLDTVLPFEGKRFVVFGLLTPDSIVSVKIDKTEPVIGTFIYGTGVENATVELYEDSVFVETLIHSINGKYSSINGYKPIVGKSYYISVSADGFPEAQTESEIVPSAIRIDTFDFKDTISSIFSGDARKLSFTFTDDGNEENFYTASIDARYKGYKMAINTFVAGRPMEASQDLCSFRSATDIYVLKDICFNGRQFNYNLGVALIGTPQGYTDTTRSYYGQIMSDTILLHFRKITRTYQEYLYLGSVQDDGFFNAFTTPTREYTNIKGGYGLWAAYNEHVVNILE